MVKDELKYIQLSQAVKPTYENETLQAENVDLCKELAKLKLENDSLMDGEENVVKLRENVCYAPKCYKKTQTKRTNYFTTS